jgi:hypothetical protein
MWSARGPRDAFHQQPEATRFAAACVADPAPDHYQEGAGAFNFFLKERQLQRT